jgi:hypothetical protein
MQRSNTFRIGDCVVLREERRDTHPSRGARDVRPEPYGEGYRYVLEEYWRISEQHAGRLLLRAQWGETRLAEANDPHLHVVSWWERLIYRHRFPKPEISSAHHTLPT